MAAGCLDVLKDCAYLRCLAVGDGIDVKFDRVLKELVDEDGLSFRRGNGLCDVRIKLGLLVDNPPRTKLGRTRTG